MANIKFSGFSAVAPVSTTLMVGVAGGVNTKFVLGDIQLSDLGGAIDLGTQVTGVLPLADGGTGASAQPAILDNVTDAASQPVNDIIVAAAAGAVFQNPSQHPNIPIQDVVVAKWTNTTNPYFNFTNGSVINIPFDQNIVTINTDSAGGGTVINFNSTSNTSFEINGTGVYKVGLNLHFFDMFGDIDIRAGVYNTATGALIGDLIDKKEVTGSNDQNFYGENYLEFGAPPVEIDIRAEFAGGSGQNPFPSNVNKLFTSVIIERIG